MNQIEMLKEYNLDDVKAEHIRATFEPMYIMLSDLEAEYTEIINLPLSTVTAQRARDCRMKIVKARTSADKVRKAEKEHYLRAGNAIQGVYNIFLAATKEKEVELEKIEKYQEELIKARREALRQEREALVRPYLPDMVEPAGNLVDMADDVFVIYLEGLKAEAQRRRDAEEQAKREAEEKARQEAEEQARIREENRILKEKVKAIEEAERIRQEKMKQELEKEKAIQEELERERQDALKSADEAVRLKAFYDQYIAPAMDNIPMLKQERHRVMITRLWSAMDDIRIAVNTTNNGETK
jgi:hypothetical protein